MATTIDQLDLDLLRNILGRLPAVDFASANGVSRLFHHACRRVLCRPKLLSACSLNPSLTVAIEEVMDKILSEPMRPHFAIACVGYKFEFEEAEQLIAARLGSNFPIITHRSDGFMGRDALSQEFKETWRDVVDSDAGIMLTVGFLPGMEVKKILLLNPNNERLLGAAIINKFVTDIREFSTSISGCNSPDAIIMFSSLWTFNTTAVMEKLDYDMSPETVIVGGLGCHFLNTHTDGGIINPADANANANADAVALVFVKNKNIPFGMGETQFHSISSSGMLPLGPACEVTSAVEVKSVDEDVFYATSVTARREGSRENFNCERILEQALKEAKRREPCWYAGVTKRRKCSTGEEKVESMTSFAFHRLSSNGQEQFIVDGLGLKKGDPFRFYLPDSTTALSSAANVSNHLRSFNQRNTSGRGKRKVFGGLVFSSCTPDPELEFFGQASADGSSFSELFPGVTLALTLCDAKIGRGDLTKCVKESQEEKSVFSCVNEFGSAYLVMSYAT